MRHPFSWPFLVIGLGFVWTGGMAFADLIGIDESGPLIGLIAFTVLGLLSVVGAFVLPEDVDHLRDREARLRRRADKAAERLRFFGGT